MLTDQEGVLKFVHDGVKAQIINNVGILEIQPAADQPVHINGTLTAVICCANSDSSLKKNICPLQNSLQKVEKLEGVTFEWKKDSFPNKNLPSGKNIGLIAQKVEHVLPELVVEDGSGYKSIDYDKLTAVLVEAIKDQQKIIISQDNEINDLKKRVEKIEEINSF